MSYTNDYAFGVGNPTIDSVIQKQYPAIDLVGTEQNATFSQFVEVSGVLWMVSNAQFSQPNGGFVQQNPALSSAGIIVNQNGTLSRAFAGPGAAAPIAWVLNPIPSIGSALVFNVVDYSADPSGIIDSTAFIQNAVNAAQTAGGGVVWFPQGQYLVSAQINITGNGVSLQGAGKFAAFLKSAPGVVAPIVFYVTGSYCKISGLGFLGNGVPPVSPPPNAASVIVFSDSVTQKVWDCYFTLNQGDCIDFLDVKGGEVYSNTFYNTGYAGAGFDENLLATPFVWMDKNSTDIKCHHNHGELGAQQGFRVHGTGCEISYNYLLNCGLTSIRVGGKSAILGFGPNIGNQTRVICNTISGTIRNITGGTGVYMSDQASNCVYMGNVVFNTDGDGMAFAGCDYYVVAFNVAYNCCVGSGSPGDCGFQFNPQSGNNPNVGAVYIGNVSYDNQATPTQQNGMRALGPGASTNQCVIVGNSFPGFIGTVGGNPQHGIEATDSVLNNDTNVVSWNTPLNWSDRIHLGAPVTIGASQAATDVALPPGSIIQQVTVSQGVYGLNRGHRIVAYGYTTGTGTFQLYLSLGLAGGSAFGDILTTGAATSVNNASWTIEVEVVNAGVYNSQRATVTVWYNGSILSVGGTTFGGFQQGLAADTSQDVQLVLQASTAAATTVVAQACNIERI